MNAINEKLEYQNDRQEYVYLKSFLENVVSMPVGSMTDVQFAHAECGCEDLFVRFKDGDVFKRIIIVNRVDDFAEAKHQIDRYVYNAVVEDFTRELDFETWISDAAMHCAYDDEYDNIRLVYISKDGKKHPSEESLTSTLRSNILPSCLLVSYDKVVLPWLNSIQTVK